jgi:general secretion pathway protein D
VKAGNLYKIVRIEGARERAVPTIIGTAPDPQRATSDEVITQIIPLRSSSVADLGNLIRPLISARGSLIAHRETNVLIVTDTASNVRRLLEVVRLVDVEVATEELQIIPIRFADASDLETILNRLFQAGRVRPGGGAPGAAPVPPPAPAPTPPRPPGAPGAPPGAAAEAAGGTSGADRPPLIVAVKRTNSLMVHARRHELETIRRLVAQLDVNIYGGRRVFIYYAENAKAKDLAATLNAIYGARETVPTATPTPTAGAGRRAGEPPPPPPPPPTTAPGAALSGTGTGGDSGLEGQVRFIADETTNAVIVTTFPHNWAEIEGTIKQLDRMPRQVLIEVLVAEITLRDDMSLGVDWALREGRFAITGGGGSTIGEPFAGLGSAGRSIASLAVPSGLTAFTFATDRFMSMLRALAAENLVNVVSTPHILTSENKKAIINVSNSIPIVTSQQTPLGGTTTIGGDTTPTIIGTQTVEYRDAGVILTVTPRIGEQGTVALDVKQEVNDVATTTVGVTSSPTIIKREAETSVVLVNNQTLVLGGLIQENRSTSDTGVPVLKNIPILGYLFSTKSRGIRKTELLILITPRVIGTPLDAARLTDEMRRATPQLEDSIKSAPRQPTVLPPGAMPAPPARPAPPPPPGSPAPVPGGPVAPVPPSGPPPR